MPTTKKSYGFTLIELLIVIAIIAIIASVIFVALNPLARFRQARDSARYEDIGNIEKAIQLYIVDNGHAPYLQDSCGPENPATDCYTNETPGAPKAWTLLQADLAPYLATLPKDPCGVNCFGNPGYFAYNYYAPGYYYALCSEDGNCGTYESMTPKDAMSLYALYAENFESETKSFGTAWNQFHSY